MSRYRSATKRAITRKKRLDALYTIAYSLSDSGRRKEALIKFLSGAKQGDPNAQNMVGYIFDTGAGVRRNRTAALHWYKRAFRNGSRAAASNIGTVYRDENNRRMALFWFRRAVRLRDAGANVEIAKLLVAHGDDSSSALPYLKRAVNSPSSNITEASREEAASLLKKLSISNGARSRT